MRSLRALAHEQWDTEMWEGELDWHWTRQVFPGWKLGPTSDWVYYVD